MSAIRTNNPLLRPEIFEPRGGGRFGNFAVAERGNVMTIQGTVNVMFILMGLTIATAVVVWTLLQQSPMLYGVTIGGSLLALVLTLVCSFKPKISPYVGWLIAICEGALAGGLSVIWTKYAARNDAPEAVSSLGTGLVLQALLLTGGIAVGLLLAYKTRLIRATENFKLGVFAATAGICFVSLGSMVLNMFGVQVPYIWGSGIIGIGFAGFVVVTAALNLVLDFDYIEQGAANQLPKHMEWYAGIGLLVTLVWLYISILRLLAKLADRR